MFGKIDTDQYIQYPHLHTYLNVALETPLYSSVWLQRRVCALGIGQDDQSKLVICTLMAGLTQGTYMRLAKLALLNSSQFC